MPRSRRNSTQLGSDWAASSAHAAATLWHRLSMFGAVAMMSQTERQTETARMIGEKFAAAYEGGYKAGLETLRIATDVATGKTSSLTEAHAAIADAAMQPAFRLARANARRLNRRSLKG